MKAVVYEKYGPPEVLHLTELAKPVPQDNEVLIKVYATTVHRGDSRMRSFTVPRWQWFAARLYLGITRPRRNILGMELAGEIESVGKKVTSFKKGDQVFASTFGVGFGAYAEFICMPEHSIITTMPDNMSYEEAAAGIATGAVTALKLLRKAKIKRDQKVLIYGASGSVGTFAIQLAKYFGADVTGVCSTANIELVKSLGADTVIDYTKGNVTDNNKHYDLVFDAVAKLEKPYRKKLLTPNGNYISVHDSLGAEKVEDLIYLKEIIEARKLRPVIDRTYTLDQIVEAHRYVDKGHKKGNVVITLKHSL